MAANEGGAEDVTRSLQSFAHSVGEEVGEYLDSSEEMLVYSDPGDRILFVPEIEGVTSCLLEPRESWESSYGLED